MSNKKKHLFETPGGNHKVHPLHCEAPAQLNCLNMALSCPGEGREKEAHAEGVVNVTQSINEGGIPATSNNRDEGEVQDQKKY